MHLNLWKKHADTNGAWQAILIKMQGISIPTLKSKSEITNNYFETVKILHTKIIITNHNKE